MNISNVTTLSDKDLEELKIQIEQETKRRDEEKAKNVILLTAATHAEELAFTLRELHEYTINNDREQLSCGLHMMSVYEKLMLAIEGSMHESYRKNLEQFRKKNLYLE